MIYVEEKDLEHQLKLLSFLTSLDTYELVIWFYPESIINKIATHEAIENHPPFESVTTYEEGISAKRTKPIPANAELISNIASNKQAISKNIDSLALYKPSNHEWAACTIGHEGMSLIKDSALINTLIEGGYNASQEAPSWW